MEKYLIQTISENEILCESDLTFSLFWYEAISYLLSKNEREDGRSSLDLRLMPKSLKLFALKAQAHVCSFAQKKRCLGNLAIWFFCKTVWIKGVKPIETASFLPKGNFRGFWMRSLLKKYFLIQIETKKRSQAWVWGWVWFVYFCWVYLICFFFYVSLLLRPAFHLCERFFWIAMTFLLSISSFFLNYR